MGIKFERYIKIACWSVVILLVLLGLTEALFQIRPFWNDEWRLTYNVKFKSIPQLWGVLDLIQECPRTLLSALKVIAQFFDYSYYSFRLPALVFTVANLGMVFYLRKRLFGNNSIWSYLFVMVIIGSDTFVNYIVQFKHYEVDYFLCLVGIWQYLTLLDILKRKYVSAGKWLLLCSSFAVAPFFSYVYPIVVTPVFFLVLQVWLLERKSYRYTRSDYAKAIAPLVFCTIGIVLFYWVDVRHMLGDTDMYQSYQVMLGLEKSENPLLHNFWSFFSLLGSGLVFEIIWGVTGMLSFFYNLGIVRKVRSVFKSEFDAVRLYGIYLIVLTLVLVFSGKLMGGVGRLVAFTVPSLALLISYALQQMADNMRLRKVAAGVYVVLFLGLCGSVVTCGINTFTYKEYANRIHTFHSLGDALKEARQRKVPLLYTQGVYGNPLPDTSALGQISDNNIVKSHAKGWDGMCAEVLVKVNPEYKMWDSIAIYFIGGMKDKLAYVNQLPSNYVGAVVTNGQRYEYVARTK